MQLEMLLKWNSLILLVQKTKQPAIGDLQKRVTDIVAKVFSVSFSWLKSNFSMW